VNFAQFLPAAHMSKVNCDKRVGDKTRQSQHEIFSIKRRF